MKWLRVQAFPFNWMSIHDKVYPPPHMIFLPLPINLAAMWTEKCLTQKHTKQPIWDSPVPSAIGPSIWSFVPMLYPLHIFNVYGSWILITFGSNINQHEILLCHIPNKCIGQGSRLQAQILEIPSRQCWGQKGIYLSRDCFNWISCLHYSQKHPLEDLAQYLMFCLHLCMTHH